MVHRARDLLMRQRTQLTNALRAHLAELGIVAETGREGGMQLVKIVGQARSSGALPAEMIEALSALIDQIFSLEEQINELNKCIKRQYRTSEVAKRLEAIPGIGIITATAMAATVTDPGQFKSGRDLAAWLGLVPKQYSTGGKVKLGPISKKGDRYLRRLSWLAAHPSSSWRRSFHGGIHGLRSCWRRNRQRLSPLLLPTSWRASPGHL